MHIRTLVFSLAAIGSVAGPALAQGDGGCNWGTYSDAAKTTDSTSEVSTKVQPTWG